VLRPALARRGGPSVREAALSVRPQRAVSPVLRRGAAARSCFRREEARLWAQSSAPVRPVWWQVPAAAWRRPAEAAVARVRASPSAKKAVAVVGEAAQQVASVQWALLPAEVVAEASGATVQPPVAAAVSPVPSAQPPGAEAAGEAGSAVQVRPPVAAGWDAAGPQRAVAVAEQPDAAAVRPPAVGAEARQDAAALQPEEAAAVQRAPSVRRPAAEHPSAPPWPCREGQNRPWLAPRQAERSAHAMRTSRAASPSRRL
jgi:hypothetical protein